MKRMLGAVLAVMLLLAPAGLAKKKGHGAGKHKGHHAAKHKNSNKAPKH